MIRGKIYLSHKWCKGLGDLEPEVEDISAESLEPVMRKARITFWLRTPPKMEIKKKKKLKKIQKEMKKLMKSRSLLNIHRGGLTYLVVVKNESHMLTSVSIYNKDEL